MISENLTLKIRKLTCFVIPLLLSACSSIDNTQYKPFSAMETIHESKMQSDHEDYIELLYEARTWRDSKHLAYDPIQLSKQSQSPVHNASAKVIGVTSDDAINALASKIWLIDQAEHTIDLTYYIYKYDLAGKAILGALCNAVHRGVDVRIMIDSLGSMKPLHQPMKALETCSKDAGYIRDVHGNETDLKARVQFVIINALTSTKSWSNRRSHDKIFIKDGSFPGKDVTITGGRNISLDYYGIDKYGDPDPHSYLDLEVALTSPEESLIGEGYSVGQVTSFYYSLLFLHKGNRRITPFSRPDGPAYGYYEAEREDSQDALNKLMAIPAMKSAYDNMSDYLYANTDKAEVRLAHQLENFTSTDVVASAQKTKAENPNSIEGILNAAVESAQLHLDRDQVSTLRIVSPYLFSPQYEDNDGNVTYDGAKALHEFFVMFPNINIEIITNSILTSDNYFTQSVIDMDTAPRLLLSDELRKTWLADRDNEAVNSEMTQSPEWIAAINQPRIKIYQTGLADTEILGGDKVYGKLHAKFFFDDNMGFIGTSNFDYRSRLYNNEVGYYFESKEVSQALEDNFEQLKSISLLWGSEEWLDMRRAIYSKYTEKTHTSKSQRSLFKVMKGTGLIWLF